ncbi:MAG: hypothetical protein U0M66_03830 [Bacilli bacterium]|nr:hypothetical protein [Bacilli bacterium]
MQQNVEKTLSLFDRILLKANDYMYTASIAKEAAAGKESNGGILIVGMIIVIVGLVGFIITKNKN